MGKFKKIMMLLIILVSMIMVLGACTQEEPDTIDNEDKVQGNTEGQQGDGDTQREGENENNVEGITIGAKAPDFTLENLQGDLVSLSDYRGKTVFVNFWASWCPPCKAEMPDLNKIHIENKDNDFLVLAVDVREAKSTVQKFIDEGGYEFPVVLDTDGDIATRYLVTGIPKTVVVGEDGTIRYVKMGMMTYPEMRQILDTVTK